MVCERWLTGGHWRAWGQHTRVRTTPSVDGKCDCSSKTTSTPTHTPPGGVPRTKDPKDFHALSLVLHQWHSGLELPQQEWEGGEVHGRVMA